MRPQWDLRAARPKARRGPETESFCPCHKSFSEKGSSFIDVMFLVDSSRQTIAERHWQIGEAAAEVLMDFGIVVSPVVENRAYHHANVSLLPFFKTVQREGAMFFLKQ